MRLFYAAYLSRGSMDAYQALVDSLIREHPGDLRSVPRNTHHLTLAFLGEIAETEIEVCENALHEVAGLDAFEYSLGQPDILMGRGRPRLIRVGISAGEERIVTVQRTLIDAVADGIPSLDTRSKPPHVTLARFNKRAARPQARAVGRALAMIEPGQAPTTDRFSRVRLVRSSLTPSGPIYENVQEIELVEE